MKFYQLFPEEQAKALCEQLRSAQWAEGKARTKELTGTVKQNEEILEHVALQTIGQRLAAHPEIALDHIPLQVHKPKFSRYTEGGAHYGVHTDAPWMGATRTDLSCTIWLSSPDSYEGGELVIYDDGEKRQFKGNPGQCVIYDCGRPHEVLPVTSGERICAVTWIQSRVRDSQKRRLVSNFRKFLAKFEQDQPERFLEGSAIYSALLRRWIE
jgi:PKHD-type hydroxylase